METMIEITAIMNKLEQMISDTENKDVQRILEDAYIELEDVLKENEE